MQERWTGDVVGKQHIYKISNKELAKQLGCTAAYVSMVLNGKKKPKGAKERFMAAINELVELRKINTA